MNGVKDKYEAEDVKLLFNKHDLLVVMETHFRKRHKCPEYFELIGRSPCHESRGGVAIYKKKTLDLNCHVLKNIYRDVVVFMVESLIFITPYITPENSKYKTPEIFPIIEFIIECFKDYKMYLIGDLNSRCGTPSINGCIYARNPDVKINSYGKKIIQLCNDKKFLVVNGLRDGSIAFDTNFTFFRGNVKSQNDWCTNSIKEVDSFKILAKLSVSDHCPLSLKISCPKSLNLDFILEVCSGLFSYSYYDRTKMLKPKITLENMNTCNLIQRFNNLADFISQSLQGDNIDINSLSAAINDKLYEACNNVKIRIGKTIPEDKKNLGPHNFRAIAEINLHMYTSSFQKNEDSAKQLEYYKNWEKNLQYAKIKENEEFNVRMNSSWKYMSKNDPRKMWKAINYGGDTETESRCTYKLDEKMINRYFTDIFQADKLLNNPTVDDEEDLLENYHMHVPILDDKFTLEELSGAIENNGRGVGLDCVEKRVALLFNTELRNSVLKLLNYVFENGYPYEWTKQLLRPEKKKGHTEKLPKLRGVAITQLLPTLYDIILFNRFNLWYRPNPEQAGFRPKQGCLLQIFAIYVTMEFLKSKRKSLYIGFLDYEKAFDFISRGNLIKHLKKKGAGGKFIRAVANMYRETSYVPKLRNRIGNSIVAKHGVTQGRQSSTSFFSFEVQEMKDYIKIPSILSENNLLQLADDTALLAENRPFLQSAFQQCLQFSANNYLYANVAKTVFLHLSDNADTDPITVNDTTVIKPAENNEYVYLGMKFVDSDDMVVHMKRNLKDRMFHVHKFYEWLYVNDSTPLKIKVQVLYSCMFAAYLYGIETWWQSDLIIEDILLLERKLLKSILCVKRNTPDELLYIELDRHDIATTIKYRQYKFFRKLLSLQVDEAVSRKIVELH